jgi:hypothetical protein
MVREGVVVDAVVDFGVGVASPLGAEFPYRPVVAVLRVEELDERVEGVAVRALGVGATGARGGDD